MFDFLRTETASSVLILFEIFFPFIAAVAAYIIGRKSKKARDITVFAATIIVALAVSPLSEARNGAKTVILDGVFGLGLKFSTEGLGFVYLAVTALMWLCTALFSMQYFKEHYRNRNRFFFFYLITLGAVNGLFLAADFYTFFIFFEIMSFASYTWVAHDETSAALRAAGTYLGISVIGGLSALMGMFLLFAETGTLDFAGLPEALRNADNGRVFVAGLLMLAGFGAKAGAIPLHVWLPKAHPVAPAPSSALLSGVLTKTGVFGILYLTTRVFSGNALWGNIIFWLGILTILHGAILALFSVDLKRTLACSSMSQIGFILVGTGVFGLTSGENAFAITGTALHMVNHSLFKLVLFMAAGVVYMNLHKLNLNDIRGFGRGKPFIATVFAVGGLGISGLPLLGGYVSKTLLHEAISEYAAELASPIPYKIAEWLFLFAGGLTFAYMLKLFTAIFIEHGDGETKKIRYMNIKSVLALAVPAVLIILLGVLPRGYLSTLCNVSSASFVSFPFENAVFNVFSPSALISALISLGTGAAVYFLIVRRLMMKKDENGKRVYVDLLPASYDLENAVYRPVLLKLLPVVFGFICEKIDKLPEAVFGVLLKIGGFISVIINAATDGIILFLRKTVFRNIHAKGDIKPDVKFTYSIGLALDRLYEATHKDAPERKTTIAEMSVKLRTVNFAANRMITRSFSFGLIMTCLGICAVIVYIIVKVFG